MTDKKESKQVEPASELEARRKAVKNILAGSGAVAGTAAAGKWSQPLIDAVITPAHAQTSGDLMLVGNVNVSPSVSSPTQRSESVLDFFIGSAHAQTAPSLAGACMTMTISGSAFTLAIEFASSPAVNLSGTVSGSSISGSGSGISVDGSVSLQSSPQTASGTVSDGSQTFGFALDTTQSACTPLEAGTTAAPTTAAPTTTAAPVTTAEPTTTAAPPPPPPPPTTVPPTTTPFPLQDQGG